MNLYWYVSRAKLELLAEQAPGFFTGIKAQLGFKFPLLSGSLEGTEPTRIEADLQRVIHRLRSENQIIHVANLEDADNPTLISFEGSAVRQVDRNVFWCAMRQKKLGLLLAGSASSAIGTQSKLDSPTDTLFRYTSADPVRAIRTLFDQPSPEADKSEPDRVHLAEAQSEIANPTLQRFTRGTVQGTIASHLTMAWAELMLEGVDGTLPRVTGLALFARSVKADPRYLESLGEAGAGIERIVVGSPIYLQQI